jgi:hypothetical protein
MRLFILAAALTLSACSIVPSLGGETRTATLAAADAATALAAGQQLTMRTTIHAAPPDTGQDPTVMLTLRHADGRVMNFIEHNHTPMHVTAQAPGGPLAQVMGLFGEERPKLYGPREGGRGGPFICGPEGPVLIGLYEAPDGAVQIVGLKQAFGFDTRDDGGFEALPYSPDQVCARLRFTRN